MGLVQATLVLVRDLQFISLTLIMENFVASHDLVVQLIPS